MEQGFMEQSSARKNEGNEGILLEKPSRVEKFVQQLIQKSEKCHMVCKLRMDGKGCYLVLLFNESASDEYAILLLDQNCRMIELLPLKHDFALKIVGDMQFDLFFRDHSKVLKFAARDSSSMWTCVSSLSQCGKLISQRDPTKKTHDWCKFYGETEEKESSAKEKNDKESSRKSTGTKKTDYSHQTLKDLWIKEQLKSKESEFTEIKNLDVVVVTFNVNMKFPKEKTTDLLKLCYLNQREADIYVFGFQEIDMSASAVFKEVTEAKKHWDTLLNEAFQQASSKYCQIASKQYVGLYTIAFAKEGLVKDDVIKEVQMSSEGVGVLGMLGNKGGIGLSFQVHSSTLCFVNTHLTPHMNNIERRNQNYHDLLKRTTFKPSGKNIASHDFVFWFGDLNYRCNMSYDEGIKFLKDENLSEILSRDQLFIEQKANRAFSGFEEGPITFPCSYRFDPGTDTYDTSEKNRIPAYTDRILWKKNPLIKLKSYDCIFDFKFSDHKPVIAEFSVPVRVVIQDKYRDCYLELIKLLDKLENDMLPEVSISTMELNFGDIRYDEPKVATSTLKNTGQVVVEYSFIPNPNSEFISKQWIDVEPKAGIIIPGESVTISVTAHIDDFGARVLNSGIDEFEDILILHLKNGRDHFFSVQGNYLKSCFGYSLQTLIRIPGPVREPPETFPVVSEHLKVPKELWRMVDYLYINGLETPSIFKSEGNAEEMLQIREMLDTGKSFDEYQGSVVSMAEVLVSFLHSFEESVVPKKFYDKCINAAKEGTNSCLEVVQSFEPAVHYNTFLYIMSFLRELLLNKKKKNTDLDFENTCYVFSQVLFSSKKARDIEESKARLLFIENFLSNDINLSNWMIRTIE